MLTTFNDSFFISDDLDNDDDILRLKLWKSDLNIRNRRPIFNMVRTDNAKKNTKKTFEKLVKIIQ